MGRYLKEVKQPDLQLSGGRMFQAEGTATAKELGTRLLRKRTTFPNAPGS